MKDGTEDYLDDVEEKVVFSEEDLGMSSSAADQDCQDCD